MKLLIEPTCYNQSGIYKIVNTMTNSIYVGSAKCFRTRFNSHQSKLNCGIHPNKHLNAAYNKYGELCFEFMLIELCSIPELYSKEQFYIDTLKPQYNKQQLAGIWRGHLSRKSSGGFKKGYKPTADTIQKKRLALERRKMLGIKKVGVKHSAKTREKMRITHQSFLPQHAKLTGEDVFKIREEIKNGVALKTIATIFGVSPSTISHINCGRKWAISEDSVLLRRRVSGDRKILVMIANVKNLYSPR